MKRIVDQFNLTKWVGQEQAREKLIQAGYRGNAPYVAFLFFRMVTPIVAFLVAAVLPVLRAEDRPAADDQARHVPVRRLSSACSCRTCS